MKSRREFLGSVATLSMAAASFHGSAITALAAPASKKALAAAADTQVASSNGLLIGSTIESGMFKNFVKSLLGLSSNQGYAFPAILDEYGYPKSTPTYTIGSELPLPGSLTPSDQLVLKFTGTGSVKILRGAPGFTVVSGSNFVVGSSSYDLTVSGANARVVFQFNGTIPGSVAFQFPAGASFAGMGNLVWCRLADEAGLDAATTPEAMFSDDYINVFRSLNAKVLRPMGLTNPNFSNLSQARYIANWQNSINVSSERWAPGAWAGSTSGTNDYTCARQPDGTKSYVDGEMIHVQFSNANNSTVVTLNCGGRGAIPLSNASGQPLQAGQIAANSLATVTYDALLKKFLWQNGGQSACVPFELQVGFANRIGANYWCNLPTFFDDASTASVAAMVRDKLVPNSNAYFEYSNEIWNFGFIGTGWAAARGAALGFPNSDNRQMHGWYGLRCRQMMGLITSTWAPRSLTQLKRTIAFQGFGPAVGTALYRFDGTDLNGGQYPAYAAAGYQNFNTAPNRPIDYCDVLSYATYYSGAQCTNFDANYIGRGAAGIQGLLAAADGYASGVTSKMDAALLFLDNDVRSGSLSTGTPEWETLNGLKTMYGTGIYGAWETQAAKYNKSIECYEGGFESNYPTTDTCAALGISNAYGGSTGKIAIMLNAYKNSTMFAAVVQAQLKDFFSYPHSKTAAWLLFSGPSQWSISVGGPFTARYQSWNGLTAYPY